MKRRLICLVLSMCLLCGCGEISYSVQDSRYTIGVLLKSTNNQHWMDVREGVMEAAREKDVRVVLLYPQNESAVEEQQAMFRDLITAEVDGIIYAPCDSANCTPLVDEATAADISVLSLDTRAEDVALPYVGADNILVGQIAAERLSWVLGEAGQVAIIAGVENQSAHRDRIEGFRSYLEKNCPKLELVEVTHADSDFRKAMAETDHLLKKYPTLDGLFCTSAVMALGSLEQQYSNLGIYKTTPALVAVDTQDDALKALQNGSLNALITQDGYEAGYQAVIKMTDLLDGKEIEETTYISTQLLTRHTVEQYIRERQKEKEGLLDAESNFSR